MGTTQKDRLARQRRQAAAGPSREDEIRAELRRLASDLLRTDHNPRAKNARWRRQQITSRCAELEAQLRVLPKILSPEEGMDTRPQELPVRTAIEPKAERGPVVGENPMRHEAQCDLAVSPDSSAPDANRCQDEDTGSRGNSVEGAHPVPGDFHAATAPSSLRMKDSEL